MPAPAHDRAYLATFWTYERRPALAGTHAALFCRVLAASRGRLGFRLHAYVVLPDRARVILATPDGDPRSAAVIVQRIKARFARELHARHGWPGRVFRDDAPLATVQGTAAIERRAEALHRDPVVSGLARHARAWTWSSLRAWSGTTGSPAEVDLPHAPDPRRAPRARSVSG
jgi:REP element-mobilizing transposase RayT